MRPSSGSHGLRPRQARQTKSQSQALEQAHWNRWSTRGDRTVAFRWNHIKPLCCRPNGVRALLWLRTIERDCSAATGGDGLGRADASSTMATDLQQAQHWPMGERSWGDVET
jgi:hypothetical protein